MRANEVVTKKIHSFMVEIEIPVSFVEKILLATGTSKKAPAVQMLCEKIPVLSLTDANDIIEYALDNWSNLGYDQRKCRKAECTQQREFGSEMCEKHTRKW